MPSFQFKTFVISIFSKLLYATSLGWRINEYFIKQSFNAITEVEHGDVRIKFSTPNGWARSRAKTFSDKEPETLEWIDSFQPGTILWDIGGNLGLYSLYTALKDKSAKVFTFEPSVFNLEIMARNVALNNLQERVVIMPIAISEASEINILHMSTMSWGGAMSTFGYDYGYNGKKIDEVFSYRLPSCSLDDLEDYFGVDLPNAIKIDVDGIEHLILKGASSILQSQKLKTILIEVNDDFAEQKNGVEKCLKKYGWRLEAKKHARWMEESDKLMTTFNQIWIKN